MGAAADRRGSGRGDRPGTEPSRTEGHTRPQRPPAGARGSSQLREHSGQRRPPHPPRLRRDSRSAAAPPGDRGRGQERALRRSQDERADRSQPRPPRAEATSGCPGPGARPGAVDALRARATVPGADPRGEGSRATGERPCRRRVGRLLLARAAGGRRGRRLRMAQVPRAVRKGPGQGHQAPARPLSGGQGHAAANGIRASAAARGRAERHRVRPAPAPAPPDAAA